MIGILGSHAQTLLLVFAIITTVLCGIMVFSSTYKSLTPALFDQSKLHFS